MCDAIKSCKGLTDSADITAIRIERTVGDPQKSKVIDIDLWRVLFSSSPDVENLLLRDGDKVTVSPLSNPAYCPPSQASQALFLGAIKHPGVHKLEAATSLIQTVQMVEPRAAADTILIVRNPERIRHFVVEHANLRNLSELQKTEIKDGDLVIVGNRRPAKTKLPLSSTKTHDISLSDLFPTIN